MSRDSSKYWSKLWISAKNLWNQSLSFHFQRGCQNPWLPDLAKSGIYVCRVNYLVSGPERRQGDGAYKFQTKACNDTSPSPAGPVSCKRLHDMASHEVKASIVLQLLNR